MIVYFNRLYTKLKNLKKRHRITLVIAVTLFFLYAFCLPRQLFSPSYSTVVEDCNGTLLGARISKDQQWRFPPSTSLPDKYIQSVICFEDQYFKYHWGVNPIAIVRALMQNIKSKRIVSGGSTISMQTIRLARQKDRTFGEKFIEAILASRLEFRYSKKQILNLYASHAPMGGNIVGVEAASWRLFGHDAKYLTWAEAATLAVLPNSPARIHISRERELLKKKRNRLLKKLLQQQKITDTDYNLAIQEPIPSAPHQLPSFAPHLVTMIAAKYPGKRLRTTINYGFQQRTEQILELWHEQFAENNINNLAAIVVNLESFELMAYCGNVNYNSNLSSNKVDVIQAPRSTGSILKPFLFASMSEDGSLLPDEILPDVPININGFTPKNFSRRFDGMCHAKNALARSLNIPFVNLLHKFGIEKFHSVLQKAGMSTLTHVPDHYGLSLILGGAEGTLWEISNIYGNMARNLNHFITHNENIQYETFKYLQKEKVNIKTTPDPIFSPGATWLTFDALTELNRPEEIDWKLIPSMQKVAWKTGTSYGFRDGWAIGVTPKYLVGVWVGNASGEGRPGLTGALTAGRVMFDLFNILPSTEWFTPPIEDLKPQKVCKESGLLLGANCPEDSEVEILIPKNAHQAKACTYHKILHLSSNEQYRVFKDCAGSLGMITKAWFVLPPSWEWYYKQTNPLFKSIPPLAPSCQNIEEKNMEFIYPYPNSRLKIARQLDGEPGPIIAELAVRHSSGKIFWHLDDHYLGETTDIHQMRLFPEEGKHILTVVNEQGERCSVRFSIMGKKKIIKL